MLALINVTIKKVQDVNNLRGLIMAEVAELDRIKESMDETSNAMDQIALTAQGQAELSQSLNEMIRKFKI